MKDESPENLKSCFGIFCDHTWLFAAFKGLYEFSLLVINGHKGRKPDLVKTWDIIRSVPAQFYIAELIELVLLCKGGDLGRRMVTDPYKKCMFKKIHAVCKTLRRQLAMAAFGTEINDDNRFVLWNVAVGEPGAVALQYFDVGDVRVFFICCG